MKYLGAVSRPVAETMAHALAHEHGMRILAFRDQVPGGQLARPATSERDNGAALLLPGLSCETTAAELTLPHLVALWEKVRAPPARLQKRRYDAVFGVFMSLSVAFRQEK